MSDRLNVELEGGKYTIVMTEAGHLSAKRYGEPWRDLVGDGMVLTMAHEIEELREKNADLLAAHEPDNDPSGPDFLEWIADRLVHIHGESPNVDFVLALRRKAARARAAIAKAKG